MEQEFELKKITESINFIQYEVLRKGLYYGLLSVDKEQKPELLNNMKLS